jgi:hypothetical protein
MGREYSWTEASAVDFLRGQIGRWQRRGWNFPGHLLDHFLTGTGEAYNPTDADKDEVEKQSHAMIVKILANELPKLKIHGPNAKFRIPEQGTLGVKWVSERDAGILDALTAGKEYKYMDQNDDLFLAYGAAELVIQGTIVSCSIKDGIATGQVKAKVTIDDDYTFAPKGGFGQRLLFDAYSAARALELRYKYKPFHHTLTFPKNGIPHTYTFFELDS